MEERNFKHDLHHLSQQLSEMSAKYARLSPSDNHAIKSPPVQDGSQRLYEPFKIHHLPSGTYIDNIPPVYPQGIHAMQVPQRDQTPSQGPTIYSPPVNTTDSLSYDLSSPSIRANPWSDLDPALQSPPLTAMNRMEHSKPGTSRFPQQYDIHQLQHGHAEHDQFLARLNDAKAHLKYIESTMTNLRYGAPSQIPHQSNTLLPLSLHWQLDTSLRSDVQDLDGRLGPLEQAASEVEVKTDEASRNVNIFTPSTSIVTAQESEPVTRACYSRRISTKPLTTRENAGSPAHVDQEESTLFMLQTDSEMLQRRLQQAESEIFQMGVALRKLQSSATQASTPPHEDVGTARMSEQARRWQISGPMDGLVSRDQEIARLDELLRNAEERLSAKEEDVGRLTVNLSHVQNTLSAKIAEMNDIQNVLRYKEETLDRFMDTENSGRVQQRAMEARLLEAENLLRVCQVSKAEEVDQLRDFCEQKDAVISKLEQVLARGARLMEQKDEESQSLSQRLTEVGERLARQERQRVRTATVMSAWETELLQCRDAQTEIKRLCEMPWRRGEADARLEGICRMVGASMPWSQGNTRAPVRPTDHSHTARDASPFGAEVNSTRQTPRAIDDFERRPQSARRKLTERPPSGHPSPITCRFHDSRKVAHPSPRPYRYVYPPKDDVSECGAYNLNDVRRPQCNDDGRKGNVKYDLQERIPETHNTRGQHASRHQSRSGMCWPPLPAPVQTPVDSARKAKSMADIRAVAQISLPHSPAKHEPDLMQRRGQLQAYVETEGESSGEGGGGEV